MKEPLSHKKILKFWIPLSATWLMMSVEGPFLTALIARMPNPEFNLAAYGVAFALALIIESPVIMMMSASVALVRNKYSFYKLRNFVYSVNFLITLFIIILIIPAVFYFLTIKLMNLPPEVAMLTHKAVILLIPWPAAIGYRRFYQGIMISGNATRRVAYGTIIRMSSMFFIAVMLIELSELDGVVIGASALSTGVIMEALASRLMANKFVKNVKQNLVNELSAGLSYREIIKFYYPLALTSFISLGIHPVVTFFMGQSNKALESLAVLPVLNSLVFFFRSFGLSFQEVGIALMGENRSYYKLRSFAFVLGIAVVIGLGLISFTPLSDIWFQKVAGLSVQLSEFSKFPLMLYTIFPATTVLINLQRAILVYFRKTNPITYATIIEVVGIIITLIITIKFFSMIGVIAAIIAYTLGRIAAIIYLIRPFKMALDKNKE
jgi:O-antigen/teichoic acid export membrane protein